MRAALCSTIVSSPQYGGRSTATFQFPLPPKNFEMLHSLMKQGGRPVQHNRLLTSIWGPEYGNEREYLRVLINQLRKKIEDDPAHPTYILTESHIGYRFRDG